MSRRPSTTSHTPASCSARVVTTCSSPVLSETGQVIRLRRSPVAKRRIPSNSVPLPIRRDRCRPTRPSGCGTSARLSYGAVCGSTLRPCSGMSTGPQRHPAHGAGQGDPLGPDVAAPPAARAELDRRQAVGDQRARGAVRRPGDDVGRRGGDAGDLLDAGQVVDRQPRRGALPLVQAVVVDPGVELRDAARAAQQSHDGQDDERGGQHHQHVQAEHHSAGETAEREQAGPDERRGRPPGGHAASVLQRARCRDRGEHGVDDAQPGRLGHPEVRLDGDPVRRARRAPRP